MNSPPFIIFDQYQRYHFIRGVVEILSEGEPQQILEVGAANSPLRSLLPANPVILLDPGRDFADLDLYASGVHLPFRDRTFPFVVSTDVLEHLRPDQREAFIHELQRVTSKTVILGFPTASSLTREADKILFEFIRSLQGQEYVFLKEHIENGLPDQVLVRDLMRHKMPEVLEFRNANLHSWLLMMMTEFILETHPEFVEARKMINEFFNSYYETGSHEPPCYRTFLVGSRDRFSPLTKEKLEGLKRQDNSTTVNGYAANSLGLALTFHNALTQYEQDRHQALAYQQNLVLRIQSLEEQLRIPKQHLQQMQVALQGQAAKTENLNRYLNLFLNHPAYKVYKFFKNHFSFSSTAIPQAMPQVDLPTNVQVIPSYPQGKEVPSSIAVEALQGFLKSGQRLNLPCSDSPEVTVVMILYNRAELTFQCLSSLILDGVESKEILLVDNASSDSTSDLLEQLAGPKMIRNKENLHFLSAANQAAKRATGTFLLFLNNDTQLLPGSLASALRLIQSSDGIGAVGGKLIFPDGRLQEAGSIVWKDGSCVAYGRGDDPWAPQYMFQRNVDFCSAAFLLTRRETFHQLGGFDEDYRPAYYEEADYCMRLWQRGLRVLYDPEAILLHHEFASSSSAEEAIQLQTQHQEIFVGKHQEQLPFQWSASEANLLNARTGGYKKKILFVDDRVPHHYLGSGLPRSNAILSCLVRLGCLITLFPIADSAESWRTVYKDIPRSVEVMTGYSKFMFLDFLISRKGYYDTILISRPHNMQVLKSVLAANPLVLDGTRIVYDAEAIFAFREADGLRIHGQEVSNEQVNRLFQNELHLASSANCVLAVSRLEQDFFIQNGIKNVQCLGHSVPPSPGDQSFELRSGLLFVGAVHDELTPNADSILWFAKEIFPLIRRRLPSDVLWTVAGFNRSARIANLHSEEIRILGPQNDLTEIYNRARVFVAPARFAAGLPIKVLDAAAHGLPVVATSLLAKQLGWRSGVELLVADDPNDFANKCIELYNDSDLWSRLRKNALERVDSECSPEKFESALKKIFLD